MSEGGAVSLVLFSGTDDRLSAAAILAAGAAAMGRRVNVLLQYWALDAFRADRILKDHGAAPEAGADGRAAMERQAGQHWSETFRQAKQVGEVSIHACSHSVEMLGLVMEDLDPLVDGQEGVASFFLDASGSLTFI
ncbi:MAG: DsrE/DsrF/DrsH-like family protein [Actinomycetota bacterium]